MLQVEVRHERCCKLSESERGYAGQPDSTVACSRAGLLARSAPRCTNCRTCSPGAANQSSTPRHAREHHVGQGILGGTGFAGRDAQEQLSLRAALLHPEITRRYDDVTRTHYCNHPGHCTIWRLQWPLRWIRVRLRAPGDWRNRRHLDRPCSSFTSWTDLDLSSGRRENDCAWNRTSLGIIRASHEAYLPKSPESAVAFSAHDPTASPAARYLHAQLRPLTFSLWFVYRRRRDHTAPSSQRTRRTSRTVPRMPPPIYM
jgi:hypothetical protein